MREELDQALCRDFPNLYGDRFGDMRNTAMCWGFPGDGWEPIIRRLSEKIENWIVENIPDETTEELIEFRKMKEWKIVDGEVVYLDKLSYTEESLEEHLKKHPWIRKDPTWNEENKSYIRYDNPRWHYRATQVKEKFGTLRFYAPGNDLIFGWIVEAEKESETTCEDCGKKGKLREDLGWYLTLCLKCYKEHKK